MRNNHDPDVLAQALADPSRRALLENLRLGKKTVTQLVSDTGLKQPNVSNHLAKMRQQDIVRAERLGRQVHYSLSTPFAEVMLRMLEFAANPMANGVTRAHTNPGLPESDATPLAGSSSTTASQHTEQKRSASDTRLTTPSGSSELVVTSHTNTSSTNTSSTNISTNDAALAQWRDVYFNAIMAGNEDSAINLVNALLALRLSMESIYIDVFQWGVNYIGELYQRGETDEVHEHMASEITERMMTRVIQFYTPVARTTQRALLGCVAGNWHLIGIRMLSDGLKGMGWETVFLGADVPTLSFISMTKTMCPDLVVVSCAMEDQSAAAHQLIAGLNALRQNNQELSFQLVAGGHYFQKHAEELTHLPIDFTASDLPEFLDMVKSRFG